MMDIMRKGTCLILGIARHGGRHSTASGNSRGFARREINRCHAALGGQDPSRLRQPRETLRPFFLLVISLLGHMWVCPLPSWSIGIEVVRDNPSGTSYTWESTTPQAVVPLRSWVELGSQNPGRSRQEPVLNKTMENVFDSSELTPHLDGVMSGPVDVNELRKAYSTMHESLLNSREADARPIEQEIRYRMPDAGEVYLVWGINGWKPVPAGMRPAETTINDHGRMSTRMRKVGDDFLVALQVPPGAAIDFGFWTAKKKDGTEFGIWDADKYPSQGYQVFARAHNPVMIVADPTMVRFRKADDALKGVRATQEIRYPQPGAREVFLMWGVNGWRMLPESDLPRGTIVKDGKMLTPLLRDREVFTVKIQVPIGTTLDYGFLVTRTHDGKATEVWDDNHRQFFHSVVKPDGVMMVNPTIRLPK